MENHKTPFSIDKKDVVLVKPSKPTPSDVLSFSTIDNNYVLELICQTVYVYQASVNSSNGYLDKKSDPSCLIKEALSKALFYYYPLAGKLKRYDDGRLRITCNGDGVPFLEAKADCNLSSLNYFEGIDVETAKKFVFGWPSESEDGYHPLVLQVTKFSCGGFTIGMGLSHSVCDGFGAAQFFRAMAELASGKSEPSVKPVWGRERLVGKPSSDPIPFPMDRSSSATSPYLPTTELLHESFNVNSESIKKLKMSLMRGGESEKESITTLEALGAYVWRSRTRALELNPDGKTLFCLAMGIRHILNPPLPCGYYGNAFLSSSVVVMIKDLCDEPLFKTVKLIKEAKRNASNHDYMMKALSALETVIQMKMKIETNGASLVLTDWRQLSLLEEMDFGWKESVNIIPLPWDMFGYVDLCIFMPPCKLDLSMKGGVRVMVSLPKAAMSKFREEMDALRLGNEEALF